jgi:hypothetical protein
VFDPGRPFQPGRTFVGKAMNLPESKEPGKPARNKYPSLLGPYISMKVEGRGCDEIILVYQVTIKIKYCVQPQAFGQLFIVDRC